MAQISQNKLTPLLVLIAAVVVGVILYKQGQSDAVPAGRRWSRCRRRAPETERGRTPTPDETLRTVVGETRALSAQLRELREEKQAPAREQRACGDGHHARRASQRTARRNSRRAARQTRRRRTHGAGEPRAIFVSI